MKLYIPMLVTILSPAIMYCQQPPDAAKIIFNGGYINITNGASIIVQNTDPLALTILNGGGIISAGGQYNAVKWNIGNDVRYTFPFIASDLTPIPVSFTPKNAVGAGSITLNTYSGAPDWNNENYKPSAVGNIDRNGINNSDHVIDRFWKLDAEGFTAKPALTDLALTYRDAEWNESGNNIDETSLSAQRWNDLSRTWSDFSPSGNDNAANNTVTVASVNAADLFVWWTLVDAAYALPVQLISFTATADRIYVDLAWKTASEINTNYFTIEKTKDLRQIVSVGTVPAAGNSSLTQHYSLIDKTPFKAASFYRLKTTDKDGKLSYSQWQKVSIATDDKWQIYPNPVTDIIYIQGDLSSYNKAEASLITISGTVIRQLKINDATTFINVAGIAAGTYWLRLNAGGHISTFKIIKN